MNYSNRTFSRSALGFATSIAFGLSLACAGSIVQAGEPVAGRGGSSSLAVSVADLNLNTPAGQSIAEARIQKAAHRVCEQVVNPDSVVRHPAFAACVDEAVASALRQVQPASLVASKR